MAAMAPLLNTAALVTIPGLRRPLTPAERRVVALVGEGLVDRAIAARLGCQPRTVRMHVAAAAEKLGESGLVPSEGVLHPKQSLRLFMSGFLKRS